MKHLSVPLSFLDGKKQGIFRAETDFNIIAVEMLCRFSNTSAYFERFLHHIQIANLTEKINHK